MALQKRISGENLRSQMAMSFYWDGTVPQAELLALRDNVRVRLCRIGWRPEFE
jgi:hypothetical protein